MIHLYIKTHKETGLKYFGKTYKDPKKYKGSGKYWKRHLEKYGNSVHTEVIASFEDELESSEFALKFSIDNKIIESREWANLINENGLDGAPKGNILKEETKNKISKSLLGKPSVKTKYTMKESFEVRSERSRMNNKNTLWINNGIICKRVKEGVVPDGWVIGRLQTGKIGDKNLGKRNSGGNTKGKVIYNNGTRHAYFFENTQPIGWIGGKMQGCQGGTGSFRKGKKYDKKQEKANIDG
jgi:hypothetical protein